MSNTPTTSNRAKAKRVTQACDFCHRRGLKCREPPPGSLDASSCLTCLDYGQQCTRHRRPKKRGTKPQGSLNQGEDVIPTSKNETFANSFAIITGASPSSILTSRKIITALLDVYLDTIHPMFPFFCEREIWVGWRDGTFPHETSDYTSLMCMCALSAQHVGNGALFTDDEPLPDTATFAQDYLREATRLVSLDMESAHLVDLIRSYGFLALLGAQNGDTAMVHKYLAYYHGACAQSNFHDESKWPADASVCEREVRRRLWWAMYRLEVQTACVLGSLIRCSETQCDVGYPSGPHHPAFIPGREGQFEDWFSGWNATTDLYRVLEHVVSNFRSTRRNTSAMFPESSGTDTELVMEKLATIQEQLQPQFGAVSSRSTDSGRNRCGFQACNILCTIHLARMITCLTGDNSLASACRTAQAMMESMDSTPPEYIRATGSPLLQQLAGVGHMLLGVARKNIPSQTDYSMLRSVLVSIITFLARFGEYSKLVATAQEKLSAQLVDFDHHVQSAVLHTSTVEEDDVCHEPYFSELNPSNFTLDGNDHAFLYVDLLKDFTWPYGAKSPR